MASELEYSLVDVFTERRYAGNPAAVVFGGDGVSDEQLQAVSAEFGQSATTFVLPSDTPEAAVRFRMFTPSTEVEMCGHGIIAGVHAILEKGRFSTILSKPGSSLRIETAGGVLEAQAERIAGSADDILIWMLLPTPRLTSRSINADKLADLLGIEPGAIETSLPIMETQDEDLIVFVKSYIAMLDARPYFAKLAAWCVRRRIRGICLATVETLSPAMHVQSRFFAPASGVNEESATGSVHGPLAAYLMAHELVPHDGRTAAITCVQAEAGGRSGLIRALVTQEPGFGFSVRIAGQCQTTMRGILVF